MSCEPVDFGLRGSGVFCAVFRVSSAVHPGTLPTLFARGGLALLTLPRASFNVVIPLSSSRDLFMIGLGDVPKVTAVCLRSVRGLAALRGEIGVAKGEAPSYECREMVRARGLPVRERLLGDSNVEACK